MNNPFSLSVVAPSQKSTPPNELVVPNDFKMEGSLFWHEKPLEDLSQQNLNIADRNNQFSRASSRLSQSSDFFQKKVLETDLNTGILVDKLSEQRKSAKPENLLGPQVLNPNIVQHLNFNIPEPIFEQTEENEKKLQEERNLLNEKFEKKCKNISQRKEISSSNIFSFNEMKMNPKKKKNLNFNILKDPIVNKFSQKNEKCFYTDLFLTSKKNSKIDTLKSNIEKKKTHVNLSKLNVKKGTENINNCKITGSRRGSQHNLSEYLPSVYSTEYPRTDPRKMNFSQLKIPKHIFMKINGILKESPITSIGKNINSFIFTSERKMQGRVQLNQPMTPNIRYLKLEPTQFRTPCSRPNLNGFLNNSGTFDNNGNKVFFPKSMTMTDLGKEYNSKNLLNKKKKKTNKTNTPKIKKKTKKKKAKNGSSKKKKNERR